MKAIIISTLLLSQAQTWKMLTLRSFHMDIREKDRRALTKCAFGGVQYSKSTSESLKLRFKKCMKKHDIVESYRSVEQI